MSRTKSFLFIIAVLFATVSAEAAEKRQAPEKRPAPAAAKKPAAAKRTTRLGPHNAKGYISVFGTASPTEEQSKLAQYVGFFAAKRGYIVLNGGKGGVMDDVSKGARQGNGFVIGIMPDGARGKANRWVDMEIPTGLGALRNTVLASAGDGAIAIGKTRGTTSEVGWALRMDKTVVSAKGHVQPIEGVIQVPFPRGKSEMMRLALTAREMVDSLIKEIAPVQKATKAKAGGPLVDVH